MIDQKDYIYLFLFFLLWKYMYLMQKYQNRNGGPAVDGGGKGPFQAQKTRTLEESM